VAKNLGKDTCRVLVAAHILTGCDATSKVGTKQSSLKADPAKYLKKLENVARQNLVKWQKLSNISYRCYNLESHLPLWMSCSIIDFSIVRLLTSPSYHQPDIQSSHSLQCWYNCYTQLHCLKDKKLDPLKLAYEQDDNIIIPTKLHRILPEKSFSPMYMQKMCHKKLQLS